MVQLACMDMETILEVVKLLKSLLASTVRSRSREKAERLGAWIWGILGRCSDAGQLGSEEVSELRELGKRAVGLLVGIRDRSGKAYGNDEEEEEIVEDGHQKHTDQSSHEAAADATIAEDDATELERAKAALQEKLSGGESDKDMQEEGEVEEKDDGMSMSVEKQIRVMLDTIITIVGEFYGQRDLLEFRDIWEDETS
jgi:regulator of vacuolar morphogenesis